MTTPHNHPSPATEPLEEKILERIEHEGVTPKPRWQFALLNRVFWMVWGLSLLFAAAAAGAMIFAIANAGWEFREVTHNSLLSYLLDVLPFFWIAAITLLLLLAYENVKRTKLGYRYPVRTVVGFAIAGVLLGGFALFAGGFGQEVEQEVGRRIPSYHPAVDFQRRIWSDPDRGLLGGEIMEAESGYATFTFRTFDGGVWTVNGDDLLDRDRAFLKAHRVVRLIGVPVTAPVSASSTFHVCFVFPWEVRGHNPFKPVSRQGILLPPPPEAGLVRKFSGERSTECKGVRPYNILNSMR